MTKLESLTTFNARALSKGKLQMVSGGNPVDECTGGGFSLIAINDGNQSGHPGMVQLVYQRWTSDYRNSAGIHRYGSVVEEGAWSPM